MNWRYVRKSHLEQAYSSVPKVKKPTDVKSLNSVKASPATEAKNPLSLVGEMKKFVVWLSTSSRVSWLHGNRCIHGYRCLFRHAHGERKPSASSKRRRYSRISCYCERKTSQRLCISRLGSNEFYSTESWRIGIERFCGTHQKILGVHLVQNWIRDYPKKVNLMSEILARPVLRRNTWGNLTTSRLYQQSSVEFGEKLCKLKAEDTYVLFLGKAPKTQKIVCVSWIRSFNAQCWKRSCEFIYNAYFEKVQKHKQLTATGGSANKRVSTSFCSLSRSVRNSAITRWNASDSIAS